VCDRILAPVGCTGVLERLLADHVRESSRRRPIRTPLTKHGEYRDGSDDQRLSPQLNIPSERWRAEQTRAYNSSERTILHGDLLMSHYTLSVAPGVVELGEGSEICYGKEHKAGKTLKISSEEDANP